MLLSGYDGKIRYVHMGTRRLEEKRMLEITLLSMIVHIEPRLFTDQRSQESL